MIIFLANFAINRYQFFSSIKSTLSLQAKFKILVSFYQIVFSLGTVYGARLDEKLTKIFDIFELFSLDFFGSVGIPRSCIGSMQRQLIISIVWPYMVIAFGIGCLWLASHGIHRLCARKDQFEEEHDDSANVKFKKWSLCLTIVVLYFALPTVSKSIFDAKLCQAFQLGDIPKPSFESFLVADMSIVCDARNRDYSSLQNIFWVAFALWPILTPLMFLVLIMSIQQYVKADKPTPLADACRFLWDDYDQSMIFWDVVDTWRRLFLTGCIMFFDTREGSNRIFRLTLATIISSFYLGILAFSRPYKRTDDLYLAFVSNFLLIMLFVLGIILQICEEGDSTCRQFVGMSLDSSRASLVAVCLTAGMLVFTVLFLAVIASNKIRTPTVRLVSSGYSPRFEMPPDCDFHMFMSHVWSTGQAKTQAVARKLVLVLPMLKVWLDIDNLHDTGRLEQSVHESAVFVIYYSKGYFKSRNCRREVYAAVKVDKPIIVLYEGDISVIDEMKNECHAYCIEEPGSVSILEHVIKNAPIRWLSEGAFCASVLNMFYCRLLSHLPYYQNERKYLLDAGIQVPGELRGPISLGSSVNLLVCAANVGALSVAEEVQAMLSHGEIKIRTVRASHDPISLRTRSGQKRDTSKRASSKVALSGVLLETGGIQVNIIHTNCLQSGEFDEDLSRGGGLDDDLSYESEQIEELSTENRLDDDLSDGTGTGGSGRINHLPLDENLTTSDLSTFISSSDGRRSVLLLYLNRDVFLQDGDDLKTILQYAKDLKIHIVLIHEQDNSKGGCSFSLFFEQTPQDLIDPPNQLFKDVAIPLYQTKEYRTVSLRTIIEKIEELVNM